MLSVVCKISVVVLVNLGGSKIPWATEADVKGAVITQSSDSYLVDFSEDAKAQNFQGDYKSILVKKPKCVEVSK